ncbi:hypothetical protein CS022_01870 [Veronia nyctiphanis]|uniref:Uncharacterized protein n=1 Tax=Veronia nyctiphanis TaxID=1278244 RepID=A0A4Q0Z0L1_9GAMM|nr:hypothetical protein [Veronia nyctiphanis]RXJ74951.1 hypothetical protein CS022_01870 [Veronia nyctiphanis]
MSFNIVLLSQLVFISMLFVGGLSYYLGKRKTSTPKVAALIGVALCFVPPLNFIYLIILLLKKDLQVEAAA